MFSGFQDGTDGAASHAHDFACRFINSDHQIVQSCRNEIMMFPN